MDHETLESHPTPRWRARAFVLGILLGLPLAVMVTVNLIAYLTGS